jgi:dihydroorotate dehydrogenase
MLLTPFYNPDKSYEDNFAEGPFGAFTDGKVYEEKGEPEVSFLGQNVYLPFGIAAGPLVNGKFVKAAFEKGFDLAVYKTVRSGKYPCHPWPNVLAVHPGGDLTMERAKEPLVADRNYTEPLGITNSFGVPSFDPSFWQKDMSETIKNAGKGKLVIGSFQGTAKGDGNVESYVQDFVTTAKLVKEAGAKVMEANLSCPNEGSAHLLCFDLERTKKIAYEIKSAIGDTPLILKLAYFADQEALARFVHELGDIVQGFATINTIAAKIVDDRGEQALPGKGREMSGVCGAPIKWGGIDMVKRLHKLREESNLKYTIIGVGGVTTPADYQEYHKAGADAVMSVTGAMWNPFLAQEIKKI